MICISIAYFLELLVYMCSQSIRQRVLQISSWARRPRPPSYRRAKKTREKTLAFSFSYTNCSILTHRRPLVSRSATTQTGPFGFPTEERQQLEREEKPDGYAPISVSPPRVRPRPSPRTVITDCLRFNATRFEDLVSSRAQFLTRTPVHAATETLEAKAMQHVFTDRSDAHTEASR
jgi:hypothetical protein